MSASTTCKAPRHEFLVDGRALAPTCVKVTQRLLPEAKFVVVAASLGLKKALVELVLDQVESISGAMVVLLTAQQDYRTTKKICPQQ